MYPEYIIITMAGLGSRFKKCGYSQPKYQIIARDKSLFEWSLMSLSECFTKSTFIFISLESDNAGKFISETNTKLGIKNYIHISLPHLTKGQASTVLAAAPYINCNDSILIYNIDTYISNNSIIKSIDFNSDGFIPCFNEEGEHWSFVDGDDNFVAKKVVEKNRISNNCSIGAYFFKKLSFFLEAYANNSSSSNEIYIAPLYNHLIKTNRIVKFGLINKSNVFVLGTPEELELFVTK